MRYQKRDKVQKLKTVLDTPETSLFVPLHSKKIHLNNEIKILKPQLLTRNPLATPYLSLPKAHPKPTMVTVNLLFMLRVALNHYVSLCNLFKPVTRNP